MTSTTTMTVWRGIIVTALIAGTSAQLAAGERARKSFDLIPVIYQGRSAASVDDDSTIYSEAFEGGPGGWTTSDLTNPGPTWHKDTYNAYSGQSWWCGKQSLTGYDNNWLQYLISPSIDLSTATNPVLTCSLYWAVEPPSVWGAYDGWDGCNVWISITNGNTWDVLPPQYPAYTCQSLYSFGWLWGMGPGVPGWAGYSGGWTSARFDLSNYTISNVLLRFAFSSDAATCTADDPSLIGFFLDNIKVWEGPMVYLYNTADGDTIPSEFTTGTGPPSGNFWVLTEDSYHSPTHSWNCDDRYFLSNALVSPLIPIPAGMSTQMTYWVYCDMPDVDSDDDDYLDDYYYIEVAPQGSSIWTPLVYDWGHNGSQLQWVERTNGYWDALPTPNIDLTPWAGQNVKIRFRVVTDGDNGGGDGNGLYVDDVSIIAHPLFQNDVGAQRLIIPFPTYESQGPVNCSVDLINYGTVNQAQVPAFWQVNGNSTALIPWSSISAGDTVTRTLSWTPPSTGSYDFRAYTQLINDEDSDNDTCLGGLVEVTPAGTFELGYDHRQLTYMPDFYFFNFAPGNGPLVHFTPAADGIPGILQGQSIKAMFNSAGTIQLHIYADGSPGLPGAEVYNQAVTIGAGSIYPNWAEIDISDIPYLQGGHPNFWVWLEVTSPDNTPHTTGHLIDAFSIDHFFVYDGLDLDPTIVNFNVRAILTGTAAVNPGDPQQPYTVSLLPNFPNPFNPTTSIIFTLPAPTYARLEIYDLLGRKVTELLNQSLSGGEHHLQWDARGIPSGSYWLYLKASDRIIVRQMTLLK